MKKQIILIFGVILFYLIILNIVSADCCLRTKNNLLCQDIESNCNSQCAGSCVPSSCSNVAECKLGCCFSNSEGTCAVNSLNSTCVNNGGIWKRDASCNINECKKGCCILPIFGEDWFTTDKRCEKLSGFSGIQKNFRRMSEEDCLLEKNSQKQGACVYETNGVRLCKFVTKIECLRFTNNINNFHENYLCSNAELNTSCLRQFDTKCVDGRSEVYWFDSCGNRENTYDSNKIKSWNNGLVLEKNVSCNDGRGNINSKECGNCNYNLGSKCQNYLDAKGNKPKYGDFVCADLNCVDKGKVYINGESWCDYEGFIGSGKDVVGSRHFRKLCNDGKVVVEPCEDLRQEVCSEKTLDGKKVAECRVNQWRSCLGYNGIEDATEKEIACLKNSDCEFRIMNILDKQQSKMCTPKYPGGLDFANTEANKEVCSSGSFKCNVAFRCSKCIANCNCLTEDFREKMNEACISVGDCGASSNILGEVTSAGYNLDKKYLDNLKQYSIPVAGQKISESPNGSKKEYIFPDLSMVDPGRGSKGEWYHSREWGRAGFRACGDYVGYICGFVTGFWGGVVDFVKMYYQFWFKGGHWGISGCKLRTQTIEFNCNQWQQPFGGENCGKCSDKVSEGIPCTKYRCSSLGAGCVLLNEGTGKEICIWENRTDTTPPKITLENLSPGLKFENKAETQAKIKQNNGECLESFSGDSVNIKTNKLTVCKWDFYNNLWDDLDNEMENYFDTNHNFSLNFPGRAALLEELNITADEEINMSEINAMLDNLTSNIDLTIKCRDRNGNEMPYQIKTCTSEKDTHAPKLTFSNPAPNGYFPYNTNNISLIIYTNEPSDCRYDYSDKTYGEMSNDFSCDNALVSVTKNGWACGSTIKNENNRTYYVKCTDQPWKTTDRNSNDKSFVFKLGESLTPLTISKIEPNNTIITGIEPISKDLIVSVSGGAENGKSTCRYSYGNSGFNLFSNTGSSESKNTFDKIYRGQYNFKVSCVDIAGNIATGETEFSVDVDSTSPQITRTYNKAGSLYIETDEESECKYSLNSCDFNWENATSMGRGKSHTAKWDEQNFYYVKCKDLWDNEPISCSMIVKPTQEEKR